MVEITVERIGDEPIIRPDMDSRMGANINGPSLIRVPDWIDNPLGRYYLYFGHHNGTYILLAYADNLIGPWKTYEPGVMPLVDSGFAGHLASPDVLVDDEARQIRLYFHGSDHDTSNHEVPQPSRVALSSDGLKFNVLGQVIEDPYLRMMQFGDWYYGLAMPGNFYRSRDGIGGFEQGPNPFESGVRHYALMRRGETLFVFYSRIGDCPERILYAVIDLSPDWNEWKCSTPTTVLEPKCDYEGAGLPLVPSMVGMAYEQKRELRDPAIFEEDGKVFLLYSVAGESGIALARVIFREK